MTATATETPRGTGVSTEPGYIGSDARLLPTGDSLPGFRLRNAAVESEEATRATSLAIARLKQGDREGVRYLYARYADNVYSYVASIVRDHHDAEDVTQQIFAKLTHSLAQYEDRGAPFLSWLVG